MDNTRFMSNFELRSSLAMKDKQISKLKVELASVQKENEKLRIWNNHWQTHIWNEQLAAQCEFIHKQVKGLSDIQTQLLKYIAEELVHKKASRHVRSIARGVCMSVSTVSNNLRVLQSKKLIRYYNRGKFKDYYALKESLLFLKQ